MKTAKKGIFAQDEARAKLLKGIKTASDIVGSTMGGRSRTVVIDKKYGSPLVVNDGVTVIREIFSRDNVENMGIQLIKDASARTNDMAGDGTSGTAVLTAAIMEKGIEALRNGAHEMKLKDEIIEAVAVVDSALKEMSEKVDTEQRAVEIATVSVQDKALGKKIGKLMFKVGKHGAVSIKPSIERGVFVDRSGGMRLEGQLVGGVVDNADKWETRLSEPRILVLRDSPDDHEFETKWAPFVRQLADARPMPDGSVQVSKVNIPNLLVVAEKLSRKFIMLMNQNKDIVKWVWFRPTTAERNMKEIYEDFRSMVGGKVVHEESGVYLSRFPISDLGSASEAVVTRHDLVVTVPDDQPLKGGLLDRITAVRGQINNAEDEVERRQIEERYANLTGGVATIRVAGATEQDTNELKLRIEDAINATRSGMDEGFVPGGGVALMNAARKLDSFVQTDGLKVVKEACKSTFGMILRNADYDREKIGDLVSRLEDGDGVDVSDGKEVNMAKAGIIDPLKVIRLSLENASAVASLLLTSGYVITDEDDELEDLRSILKGKK